MDAISQTKPDALVFDIGKPIAVNLSDGSCLRAFVHAHDKASTLVCLELLSSAQVVVISALQVKSVTPLSDVADSRVWPSNPTIDMTRVRAEEDRVYRKRYAQFSQLGVGVTAAAQTIFDSLAKTLPCRWDRDNIIILDTVRLSPPYDVESISGDGDAGVVNRVKMILEKGTALINTAVDTNGGVHLSSSN